MTNPLWTCQRCNGRTRLIGRTSGQVLLACTSCQHQTSFASTDAVVQHEEQLAREHAPELALAVVTIN